MLLILLNPVAPHITEELWEKKGYNGTISSQVWPLYDEEKTKEDIVELAVLINGKVRYKINVDRQASKEEIEKIARENERLNELLAGKQIVKIVVVPNSLVNIVVK